jgi:GcrA cell cycle regulator
MPDEAWTAERVDLLQRLWAKGATAADIGMHLGGLSRSAVLGKIFRLRQNAGDAGGTAPEQIPAPNVRIEAAATLARRRRRTKYKKRKLPPPPVAERQHKTLFELTNTTCRWPFSIWIMGAFCGALATHFFWHWCPAGSINVGMLRDVFGG